MNNLCRCTSGNNYENCCEPFHEGALPVNALQLMRSRFSAYALDKPDYIIASTHPANPWYLENKFSWRRSLSQFSRNFLFERLEILDFKEGNEIATVTFTAYLTHDDIDATFTENSVFEKRGGRWLYKEGRRVDGRVLSLVTNRPLKILPLAYYGDPILRMKAAPIPEITEEVKKLVDAMIETMDSCDGIGIAAPQVHHSIQLFIIREPIEENEKIEFGEVQVFINPILSLPSNEIRKASEGCLSIPTIRAEVKRANAITVEYTDLNGARHTKRFSGRHAQMILHENDHIEGILFIDHLLEEKILQLEPLLKSLQKRIGNDL